MLSISSYERLIAGASRLTSILTLLALVMVPDQLAAQGLPVETGSQFPVALWFMGAGVLGLAIAYGIMRNRGRTRGEKQITEQVTKNNYARKKRDRISTG
jgi:hypothetical protein